MTPVKRTVTNLAPQRFLLPGYGPLEVGAENVSVPSSDVLDELIEVGAVRAELESKPDGDDAGAAKTRRPRQRPERAHTQTPSQED